MGIISSCGKSLSDFWDCVSSGKSGIKRLAHLKNYNLPSTVGGYIDAFDPETYMPARKIPRGRSNQLACAASLEAINHANLRIDNINPCRMGVMVGTSVSGLGYYENELTSFRMKGQMSPYSCISIFAGATSSELAIRFNARGPSSTLSNGCTASTDAIGNAFHAIRNGICDIVLCGGTEAPITPAMMSGFCSLRVLSTRKCDPTQASRPFDALRDGMVLSEGSAMLVLEEASHAQKRGATILGEICGYAATCDAHHMVTPAKEAESASQCMLLAIQDANLEPQDIQCINAHGTSTQLNDIAESLAITKTFGKQAKHIPIYAIKSITGHSIGAAGAIEVVGGVLALNKGLIPKIVNLDQTDIENNIDLLKENRNQKVDVVIKNSFGFGGKNSCLIIKHCCDK